MAKKSFKKPTKQLAPEAGAKQSDKAYPAKPHELDDQRQRLKKAAIAGSEALKSRPPVTTPGPHTAPAAPPPLSSSAALQASPPASAAASKPPQAPAPEVPKPPAEAATPQTLPTPAAQPAKPVIQPEPAKSPVKDTPAEAPTPPAPLKVKITFALVELGAKQVSLSGEFNGWSPDATPMKRHQDGHWETTVDLVPGRYQYKFIVDGHWIPDPHARENVPNQHGTLNSVVEVRV